MVLTLSELAQLVDGNVVRGELSFVIEGIAALDEAKSADCSFLGNEKYHAQFLATCAGAVIVPNHFVGGSEEVAIVQVENPSHAFGLVVKFFTAALARKFVPGIHERAVIDELAKLDRSQVAVGPGAVIAAGASIGNGSEIGANSVIGSNVTIGRDCLIHPNVTVRERCVVGDRVILQPGAVIGSDGYGYELVDGKHLKIDQIGAVVLENDVEIGANTTIDRARFGRTVIGEGTKIDNLVQIGHNVQIGEHNLIVAQCGLAGSSKTGTHVTVAAQSGVAGHVNIGDRAIFAARSGVSANCKGDQVYSGSPVQKFAVDQKQKAAVRKLPELLKRVRDLEKG